MKKTIPVLLGLSLGLVGCGGGGGGGGSSDPTTSVNNPVTYAAATEPVAVTTTAEAKETIVYANQDSLSQLEKVSGELEALGNMMSYNKPSGPEDGHLPFDAVALFTSLATRFEASGTSDTLVGVTDTYSNDPCPYGGTVSGSVTKASADTTTTGDKVDISLNNCMSGPYTTLNGRMVMYINSVRETDTSFSVDISTAFVDITMVYNDGYTQESYLADGRIRETISYDDATGIMAAGVSSDRFRFMYDTLSGADDLLLTGLSSKARIEFDQATSDYTSYSSTDYTLASESLGGSITVDTTKQFVTQLSVGYYPYEGEVVVTGANGSKTRLRVIDSDRVEISYDFNGDGAYGDPASETIFWTELATY